MNAETIIVTPEGGRDALGRGPLRLEQASVCYTQNKTELFNPQPDPPTDQGTLNGKGNKEGPWGHNHSATTQRLNECGKRGNNGKSSVPGTIYK